MRHSRLLFPFLFILLFNSCRDPLDIDTSDIEIPPFELLRFEGDLFSLKEEGFRESSARLEKKYGAWYDHYVMSFLHRKGISDSLYKPAVLSFINDRDVRGAYERVKKIYPDDKVKELAAGVDEMRRRFHYHFPSEPLPSRFITCTTGWNYAFAYMDSALILALDMYLGDTSVYYKMLRYPQYQVRRMNEAHILPDIARGWLLTEFDNQKAANVLLHHTIFYGKLYYAVEALLPDVHDSLVIGYSAQQLKYCEDFEKNLWGYMASNNRLYESNLNTVRELTSEGPFTGAISKDCPPRIAMWVGWQIVRSYMKNNEKVTLEQLMQEPDAQKILSKSKYRP
jgi:hypothetical protein